MSKPNKRAELESEFEEFVKREKDFLTRGYKSYLQYFALDDEDFDIKNTENFWEYAYEEFIRYLES